MARSGDWVTPRLWGDPWFEKPPLLYWLGAAGFLAGLGPELAPRLPVAIISAAFLVFFWRALTVWLGGPAAFYSAAILATSAGWAGFTYAATPDLLLSATFGAAMLLWAVAPARYLPVAGALFGLAVLAKGLVPLVLGAVPVLLSRRPLREWLPPALVFLAVAAPWYILCYWRNGAEFVDEFLWRHHFERFSTESLQHVQPWWFYVPVLLAALFPWTPMTALLFRREHWRDPRLRFFVLWLAVGFLFFSASRNKLPGYLLPLLPAAAVLIGVGLTQARHARLFVALSVALLAIVPLATQLLPEALGSGLSRARVSFGALALGVPLVVAAFRIRSLAVAALCATAALVYLKSAALPAVDIRASARSLWWQTAASGEEVCVDEIHRAWRYGLNYYSVTPLPDCSTSPQPARIAGHPPQLLSP
jgi:4-amino-4-deoxy-L-arabinose transferase-like glycosyltransferase